MIGVVVRVETVIHVDVDGQEVFSSGDSGHPRYIHFRPLKAVTRYAFGGGGRWRVVETILSGLRSRPSAACEVVLLFGDPRKPLWVAALEHENYPKENPFHERR